MNIDYSKGVSLHNLYGHSTFIIEAQKQKKDEKFLRGICAAVKCGEQPRPNDWRAHL